MALPGSGTLSINDIAAISKFGSGNQASLGDLSNERIVGPTAPFSISDFYGTGATWVTDWSGSGGTVISITSTLYVAYNALVISGRAAPQSGRIRLNVNLSTTGSTATARYKWNSVPTTGSPGTVFATSNVNTAYTVPFSIGYSGTLYIAIYHSRAVGQSVSYDLNVLSGGTIYGGLISSFTASGTTQWASGG